MSDKQVNPLTIPTGTPVIAADGHLLGRVLEVHPHYLIVAQEELSHEDLEVPARAIASFEEGRVRLAVNKSALTVVDDDATFHRRRPEAEEK
ncbi:MAG: hypothetical protein C4345_14015 [Chloroflexota bacterium]